METTTELTHQTPNVFRFKLDGEITEIMKEFARIHKHDSRLDLKKILTHGTQIIKK
jgi:hypothetical protein